MTESEWQNVHAQLRRAEEPLYLAITGIGKSEDTRDLIVLADALLSLYHGLSLAVLRNKIKSER